MPPGPVRGPVRVHRSEGASEGSIRPSGRARALDLGLIAGMTVVGLALGWSILSGSMADYLARRDPQAALAWESRNAGALSALAERKLDAGDVAGAEQAARAALVADPLEIAATRVLGLAADRRGDLARADRLMNSAGARNHRDAQLQTWLFARTSAKGDFTEAFARADALVRAEPDMARRFYPVMSEMARRPEAIGPLALRLKTRPPWRDSFVQAYIRQASDPADPYLLIERLEAAGAPPSPVERQALIGRLVQDQRFQQAFLFWVEGLSKADLDNLTDVFDGGFNGSAASAPFNWTVERAAKGFIDYDPPAGREDRALHLVFQGAPAPGGFVRQLLVLSPGRHVLRGQVRADGFEAVAGPVWSIRCAGDGGPLLGETTPLTSSTPWQSFELAFDVPAGCDAQWLRLRPGARGGAARRMSGEVWFDKLAVTR